jgi:hypothetical protein
VELRFAFTATSGEPVASPGLLTQHYAHTSLALRIPTVVVGLRLPVFGEIAGHREPKTDNDCSRPT